MQWTRDASSADPLPFKSDEPCRALLILGHLDVGPALGRALHQEGLDVFGCGADDDVVGRLVEVRPDIVLVASWLPDAGALTICRQIRQVRDSCTIRSHAIIALGAGLKTEWDVARALDSGADDYVTDVRRVAELRERVRFQLRRLHDREATRWARQQRLALRILAHPDTFADVGDRHHVDRQNEE